MADTDIAQEQEKKGMGLSGATAGVVAGAGAAAGMAQWKKDAAKVNLQAIIDKAPGLGTVPAPEEAVASATAREAGNKAAESIAKLENGAWKRPDIVFKNAGTKTRVVMGAVTAAAAVAAAMGVKAYRNRHRSESYVDQIAQERSAAAEQAAGPAR